MDIIIFINICLSARAQNNIQLLCVNINKTIIENTKIWIIDCASKVSLSLLFYICIYCFYLVFFIIIDVLFSNEVSFNVSIGFWSLNELFQKIQRRNSEQRIEEKFSWRLKKILVQISAPNLPQKSILFQF
jgi:hypothetical protein